MLNILLYKIPKYTPYENPIKYNKECNDMDIDSPFSAILIIRL